MGEGRECSVGEKGGTWKGMEGGEGHVWLEGVREGWDIW